MRGVLGRKITQFWSEILRRERQEKLGLLDYLPVVAYIMSGVSPDIPYDTRSERLAPYKEQMGRKIQQTEHTTEYVQRRIKMHLAELKKQHTELSRLVSMDDENFLQKWLAGDV